LPGNLRGASAEASMQKRKCTLGRSVPAIALAIVLGTAAGVLATCGDGVLDPDEQCDHGAANGQDDCCSVVCELIDMDYDGTCDALDPCENGQGTRITESTLVITRLSTGAADDELHLVGTMTVPNVPQRSVHGPARLRPVARGELHGSGRQHELLPGHGPPLRSPIVHVDQQPRSGRPEPRLLLAHA